MKFPFTGNLSITTLDKTYNTPAHGVETFKHPVFGHEKDDKIYFCAEFSKTHLYKFIEYNTDCNYEGIVYDEWYFKEHKAYREIFLYLEPVKSIICSDKKFELNGIGRLHSYPCANNCLVDVTYVIEKIRNKHIITKIEWAIPRNQYEEWMQIQQDIRNRSFC